MKTFGICLLLLWLACSAVSAQTLQWEWALGAGGIGHDQAHSIAIDDLGNQYVTGFFWGDISFGDLTLIAAGGVDIFVVKLDHSGNPVWARRAGSADSDDRGLDITVDLAGNVYVTGFYQGSADFGLHTLTSLGGTDIFTAKLDSLGNWLWAASAGANLLIPEFDEDVARGVSVGQDGAVYVTGKFAGTAHFGVHTITSPPIPGYDYYYTNAFIAKLDSAGNWVWAVPVSGKNSSDGRAVTIDNSSGHVYMTGHFVGDANFGGIFIQNMGYYSEDVFAACLDTAGNFLWASSGGGAAQELASDIALTPDGNLILTGSFKYSCAFGSHVIPEQNVYRNFVAKLDSSGHWLGAAPLGGLNTQNDDAFVSVGPDGCAYLTGVFCGDVDFGGTILSSAGQYDTFVTKLDPAGNIVWAVRAGGPQNDYGKGIAVDSLGKLRVTGFFSEIASFGPFILTSYSEYDTEIFIATLGGGVSVEDELAPRAGIIRAWPNPFRSEVTLSLESERLVETGIIAIYDAKGRKVRTLARKNGGLTFVWDGKDNAGRQLGSGIFFGRPELNPEGALVKILLLK